MKFKNLVLKKSRKIMIFFVFCAILFSVFSTSTTAAKNLTIEKTSENPILTLKQNGFNDSIYEGEKYIYVITKEEEIQVFYKNNFSYKTKIDKKYIDYLVSNDNSIDIGFFEDFIDNKVESCSVPDYNKTLKESDEKDIISNKNQTTNKESDDNKKDTFDSVDFDFVKSNDSVFSFKTNSKNDLEQKVVSYKWDFGDGSFGSGAYVSHEYKKSGVYDVTLTVSYSDGETRKVSKTVDVKVSSDKNDLFLLSKPFFIIPAIAFIIVIIIAKYSFNSEVEEKDSPKKEVKKPDFTWEPAISERNFDKNQEIFEKDNWRNYYFRII